MLRPDEGSEMADSVARDVDVAVVGAGFAGVAAAKVALAAGLSVAVLEARDRVGGRVLTVRLPDGLELDAGGEWVGPNHHRVMAWADEVGVPMFPSFAEGDHLLLTEGNLLRYSDSPVRALRLLAGDPRSLVALPGLAFDLARAYAALRRLVATVPPNAPWEAPRAAELDSWTMERWINHKLRTRRGRSVLRAAIGSWNGADPSELSLLGIVAEIAADGGIGAVLGADEHRLNGGPHLVVRRQAERLGTSLQLGCPVRAIRQDGAGAVVEGDAGPIRCQHVIVTVPPPLAGRMVYDPPLPPDHDQLRQSMPMGSAVKFFALYDEPFWRHEGLSGWSVCGTGLVNSTIDNCPPEGGPGILAGFIHGAAAWSFRRLADGDKREAIATSLTSVFGPRAGHPRDVVIPVDWSVEPWTRGCYAAHLPPGVLSALGSTLRQPVGRIHFAGSDMAEAWTGYMEGAIRSGEAVAERVVAALGGSAATR